MIAKKKSVSKITVGIVGAGVIAREHAKSLTRIRAVGRLLVYDPVAERAGKLAGEFKGTACASLQVLCADSDLVWVCAPQFAHGEAVAEACAAGKAVFCEKPLAQNATELRRIERCVRHAGVPFFMGLSGRYNAVFAKLKELTAKGLVGTPTKVWSLRQGFVDPAARGAWCLDDALSGGAVVELGVHEIDFVRWVGGEFHSVCARSSSVTLAPGKCEDAVAGIGELESGAVASVDVSWSNARYVWQRGIVGTEGSLFFDDSNFPSVILHRPGKDPRVFKTANWIYEPTGESESFRNQARAVMKALAEGTAPPVTLEDGVRAVEVALAMRRAAKSGGKVKI